MIRSIVCFILISSWISIASATGLSKQDACDYPDGIHGDSIYIYWPGKLVHVSEFLKKDGVLYYFIHTFSDKNTLAYFRDSGDTSVRNAGSYLASYNCARSKVKFYPNVRSLGGTAYGKFNWISDSFLSYSLVGKERNPCTTGPDTILDLRTMTNLRLDRIPGIPRSTTDICVGRSYFKNISSSLLQFDIEEHHWATEESFYSRFQYNILTKKLKKIQ